MVQETDYIWMDGEFKKWEDANVHILTHALHYGTGVFEGIRCYKTDKGPAIFRLREHLQRLYDSAKTIFLEIPYTLEELEQATIDLIKKNNVEACYIRPIAYHGYGPMGLDTRNSPVNVAIIVWPWGAYLGEEALEKGTRITVVDLRREHNRFAGAKITGFYYNSVVTKRVALDKGFDEALLLDDEGNLAEGSGENIFLIKDGNIATPKPGALLPGITRDSVMQIARDQGYTVEEKTLTLQDVEQADEAFFTGTAAEFTPIREVDGKNIGDGKFHIIKELQKIFFDTVNGKEEKYAKWLTFVN
ncbi:branched-chain amino acid transaminase [Candidatus Woesearchaeota archaeon]|nr:MAG: branched-chain amino acid transaminase [Candidatus Woesearchaeota archaeon]